MAAHEHEPLFLIQIGANSGDFDRANHRDRDPVRPAMLALLRRQGTHALLLEPNPPTFQLLHEALIKCQHRHVHGQPPCSSHAFAVHGAFCPRSAPSIDFHRIAINRLPSEARRWNDRANGHWGAAEMNSLSRAFVERAVAHGPGIGRANASKYVETVRVPCRTAAELLQMTSSRLDALVVDTEGMDAVIVEAFLNVSSPALIMFEVLWKGLTSTEASSALPHVFATLLARGYHVYCCQAICRHALPAGARRAQRRRAMGRSNKKCDSGFNAFAWLPARLPSVPSM